MLKDGIRWRVGFGGLIQIWIDPWLPCDVQPFVSTPTVPDFEEAQVNLLINLSTKQ